MTEYAQNGIKAEDLVARATDPTLAGPEWALNLALCDCANANHTVCDDIVRFLQRRLQSGNAKVTLLALILTETLVKNGPPAIHRQVGSTMFLKEIAALSDGSLGVDVQNQALLLIRQWAAAFKTSEFQTFQDTYRQLKIQGIEFPAVENDVPIFTPPSSTSSVSAASGRDEGDATAAAAASGRDESYVAAAPGSRTREQQLKKLQADLKLVQQKIELMRHLYTCGETGEQLEDVLDFLRQCQPRMNTLIEGGVMGKIDEHTLEQCLNVNDNLMKTLEEYSKTKTKDMMIFDSPPRASHKTDLSQELDELHLEERDMASSSAAAAPQSVPPAHSTSTNIDEGIV
ncbi:unnamed protein product [Peronospora belbahrii]|uniref:VHS domain-containing protein n=1 Tax=Peronospora belbahrii TaxID=622444 RepID=A0AAU9LAX9_9STRA|nr:unnamed protein product [Peronospora belbahrii]CAH0520964.1 unnamed protein product [Peronospora belbahrii]